MPSPLINILVHEKMLDVLKHYRAMISDGLESLGYICNNVSYTKEIQGDKIIIIGANFFDSSDLFLLPETAIVINVENTDSGFFTADYIKILKRFTIFDYGPSNAKSLGMMIGKKVDHLSIFFTPLNVDVPHSIEKDIDVLFYGSINQRRLFILEELERNNIKPVVVFNVFGSELANLIGRSKIILNIHFYANRHLEFLRLLHLMTNCCAIVTEGIEDLISESDLIQGLSVSTYNNIVDTTIKLLNDDQSLVDLRQRAQRVLRLRSANVNLEKLLFAIDAI